MRQEPIAPLGQEPPPKSRHTGRSGDHGPAFTRPLDVDAKAQVTANHLNAAVRRGIMIQNAKDRRARLAQLIAEGAGIFEFIGLTGRRHFSILMLRMSGSGPKEIAALVGITLEQTCRILKRPEIVYMGRAIERAQLEKVINGEFGAKAAAKAAFPTIIEKVIEKAGGMPGVAPAARDGDQLRAAEIIGKVAGEMDGAEGTVQHNHFHAILRDMTRDELHALKERQELPSRYRHLLPGPAKAP